MYYVSSFFFFQAEDGIRDLVRSRGLGDVYKRQPIGRRDALCAITPKLKATDRLRSNPFFILIGSIKLDNNLGSIFSYKFTEMIRFYKHIFVV